MTPLIVRRLFLLLVASSFGLLVFLVYFSLQDDWTRTHNDFLKEESVYKQPNDAFLQYTEPEENLTPETNPLLEEVEEPASVKPLVRASDKRRTKAALISLVRNKELDGIVDAMTQVEDTFNHKFGYPWIFFNDEEFTDEFKEKVRQQTDSEVKFELIEKKDWDAPRWIDKDRAKKAGKKLEEAGVRYGAMESYHKMCRWNSGMFYKHKAMDDYDWYWRVEPDTQYYCDIDYDVFAYMEDNDKVYGFTIALYDNPKTVATLWPETKSFLMKNKNYLHKDNALQFLLNPSRPAWNAQAGGYSTCHFWSNFEIASLKFFRDDAYAQWFEHLDKQGGFFYERWGDAPVHSVGAGLFANQSQIHWFKDIGYYHFPYYNCPKSKKCHGCKPGRFTKDDLKDALTPENCLPQYLKYMGDQ